MNEWFTSDHHFGHANIIRFQNRPWGDVDEMDSALIDRWNSVVGYDDTVYHLGDFSLSGDVGYVQGIFSRLLGHVVVVRNEQHHDRRWLRHVGAYKTCSGPVLWLPSLWTLNIDRLPIVVCHFPLEVWDGKHYGAVHVHGHSHGATPAIPGRMDVGVDCCDYYPINIREVCELASKEQGDD